MFERNERLRYSAVAKQLQLIVTEHAVSFGEFAGLRWLAQSRDQISGHYLLRNDRAFVYVVLFRADTEAILQEAEDVLRSISLQP